MKRLIFPFFLVLFFITSCTTTKAIHDSPEDFAGENVVLSGQMTKRVPIPFTDLAVFVFTDKYGSALVLSAKDHRLKEAVVVYGTVAVFPKKSASKEMTELVDSVSDFLVENGWAEKGNANTVSKAVISVFAAVIKGLGNAFIVLEA